MPAHNGCREPRQYAPRPTWLSQIRFFGKSIRNSSGWQTRSGTLIVMAAGSVWVKCRMFFRLPSIQSTEIPEGVEEQLQIFSTASLGVVTT